jgi:bile-salt sulfotransferase
MEFIKIYSHPRSGTHFLEAFLAENFYRDINLSSDGPIYYGHWSNKILLETGEPHHKLFGSHFFPDKSKIKKNSIYIYRDGRDVIASIWNSKFYNKEWEGITFSEFLKRDLDWLGGPGQKENIKMNIVQHWFKHVDDWHKVKSENLLILNFEDLKKHPEKNYKVICKKFFPYKYLKGRLVGFKNIDPIKQKVGLAPNKAKIKSWETLFNKEDLDFFFKQLPNDNYLYKA